MQYATNVTHRTLNIFHCNVSLWKQLLDVLGVGLEYFLALEAWPWPWSHVLGLGLAFLALALTLNALALNTKSLKTSLEILILDLPF